MAGHPSTIIFLTADAFGVLPPISRLTRDQAMYHFISGYTAKLAGTEMGIKEPSAHLLDLLRRAVHAAPPERVRRDAGRADGPLQRPGLAGQHRLDRRPVRHRRADEHHLDTPDGARRAGRTARRRAHQDRPYLRLRGSTVVPRRACRGPLAARHVGRHGRLRRARRASWRRCSSRTSTPSRTERPNLVRAAGPSPVDHGDAELTQEAAWRRRFRAPRTTLPEWADDAPARLLYAANHIGRWELYRLGPRRRHPSPGDRPARGDDGRPAGPGRREDLVVRRHRRRRARPLDGRALRGAANGAWPPRSSAAPTTPG